MKVSLISRFLVFKPGLILKTDIQAHLNLNDINSTLFSYIPLIFLNLLSLSSSHKLCSSLNY